MNTNEETRQTACRTYICIRIRIYQCECCTHTLCMLQNSAIKALLSLSLPHIGSMHLMNRHIYRLRNTAHARALRFRSCFVTRLYVLYLRVCVCVCDAFAHCSLLSLVARKSFSVTYMYKCFKFCFSFSLHCRNVFCALLLSLFHWPAMSFSQIIVQVVCVRALFLLLLVYYFYCFFDTDVCLHHSAAK